jgi:PAS domain S-box-containing protein
MIAQAKADASRVDSTLHHIGASDTIRLSKFRLTDLHEVQLTNTTMPFSESFFQDLFNASPNPYLVLDRKLNIAGANRAYLDSTKRTLDDIVGRWAWDAFPTDPRTLQQAIASFERVIRTKKVDTMALLRFDIPRSEADGGGFEVRYRSITHSPVIGLSGDVEYVLQHPIDVTELERLREVANQAADTKLDLVPSHSGIFKRAQDVFEANLGLLADVDRLQTLFQQAPSFMAVLRGPDHVFELANVAMAELIGSREYVGKPLRDAVPEMVEQGFVAMLDHAYSTGEPAVAYGKAARFQRAGGDFSDRVLNFIFQPISDSNARSRAFLSRETTLPSSTRPSVCAITGYGTRHDRHTALMSGFDHYFVKPVDIAALLQLLNDLRQA